MTQSFELPRATQELSVKTWRLGALGHPRVQLSNHVPDHSTVRFLPDPVSRLQFSNSKP